MYTSFFHLDIYMFNYHHILSVWADVVQNYWHFRNTDKFLQISEFSKQITAMYFLPLDQNWLDVIRHHSSQ